MRCLVLRHLAFEDLGVLPPVLSDAGYTIDYCDMGVWQSDGGEMLESDLLIILGGPIGVYEIDRYPFLKDEIAAIRARLEAKRPTLGLCLGLQLMAAALGADVSPGPAKEIGWAPIRLTDIGERSVLAPLADLPVLHWHGDAAALPEGATRLAETDICANQAFSIGQHVLALQFHVEADPDRIEQWLIGHTVELAAAGVDPRTVRADTAQYGARTAAAGQAVVADWLKHLSAEGQSA